MNRDRNADRIALRTFGFHTLPDAEALQRRYRELLFAHHPDRNPSSASAGTTADIVRAYGQLQEQIRDRTGRPLPDEQIFQLIETKKIRIALPVASIIGFVRAEDADIQSLFLSAVARHAGQSYILYTPSGRNVSAARCGGWLLLLHGARRTGIVFTEKPHRIHFSSLTEGTLLRGSESSSFVLAGQQYRIPVSVIHP